MQPYTHQFADIRNLKRKTAMGRGSYGMSSASWDHLCWLPAPSLNYELRTREQLKQLLGSCLPFDGQLRTCCFCCLRREVFLVPYRPQWEVTSSNLGRMCERHTPTSHSRGPPASNTFTGGQLFPSHGVLNKLVIYCPPQQNYKQDLN